MTKNTFIYRFTSCGDNRFSCLRYLLIETVRT